MRPYQIVLADDHVILREGLRRIIEDAAEMEVVGEANNGLELVRLLKRLSPDLVILDISMPQLRGIEAIHEVRAIHPVLKVLVLTMHWELELVNAAITAGANGYLLKEDAESELFAAIGKVREGGTYVSPKLSNELTHDWARSCRIDTSPAAAADRLTVKERDVLQLTAEGKSSREISDLLGISVRTVEHHRAHIMAKLNLRKAADIVRYALSGKIPVAPTATPSPGAGMGSLAHAEIGRSTRKHRALRPFKCSRKPHASAMDVGALPSGRRTKI